MEQSVYGETNAEAGRSVKAAVTKRRSIEALRADLAQLDEWLTKCEELRLLEESKITPELAQEIAASPVAPKYLRREAEHRDRAILQVTDAIFVAQGELMVKLNILEGTVLWLSATETTRGKGRTYVDGPEPEDFRVTPHGIAPPKEAGPLGDLFEASASARGEVAGAGGGPSGAWA